MCSIPDGRQAPPCGGARWQEPDGDDEVDALGRAIDELACAARGEEAGSHEIAGRLARVWDMVADLDPELARRLAGYDD
jgi:hypothetical protein